MISFVNYGRVRAGCANSRRNSRQRRPGKVPVGDLKKTKEK